MAAVVLVAAGCGDSSKDAGAPTTTAAAGATTLETPPRATSASTLRTRAAQVRRQLRGIPQHGLVLGNPSAPVSIVEYGTFACPACAAVHRDLLPQVIERYVRTGKASLEFRGVAGDAPSRDRNLALSSWAASTQRHGWDFVQLAYLRSLDTVPPGARPDAPGNLAGALGLDAKRLGSDAARPEWRTQVLAAANVAGAARMATFPVFLVRARAKPNEPFVILNRPDSVGSFVDAIAKADTTGG
jgi:hypothetical protein